MGMGHAIYKTEDPRAGFLRKMAARIAGETGQKEWLDIALEVEKAALGEFQRKGRIGIQPNLDFYSAPVYHMMGIPTDLMTPVFAVSRVAGWCSHIIEEAFAEAQSKPALYRPKAEYVGRYCGLIGCTLDEPR
jgi:citrate synthase